MKPSNVATSLKILIKCRQPVFLWGPPGVGKSQVVQQITEDLELACTDVRAVLLDPVDLRGLPHINNIEWIVTQQRNYDRSAQHHG